jgi:hypothetical protein
METLESRRLLAVTGTPLRIGGDGFDMGKRILATPDGGYVAAGLFSGKVDFDPSSATRFRTAKGDTDVYVAKYDASGALQWVDQFGSEEKHGDLTDQDFIDIASDPERAGLPFINGVTSDPRDVAEYINDLALAKDGSILVAGSFIGHVDFDPSSKSRIFATYDSTYHDGFVISLGSSNGKLGWADQIGGRFTDTVTALAVDGAGSIFATGLFTRDVSFVKNNPKFTFSADGREDAFVLKMTAKGAIRWVDTFGGDSTSKPERDAGQAIAVDSAGNVFVGGVFSGKTDFDPSPTAQAILKPVKKTDGVVVKYNTNGKFLKVASFGGRDYDGISALAVNSEGDVIVAGYFQGDEFDADPGSAVKILEASRDKDGDKSDFTDLFVEKLSGSTLGMKWVRQLSGTGSEFADDMAIDSADNIVIGGSFYGKATFGSGGPTLTTDEANDDFNDPNDKNREEDYDIFLWKIDTSGTTTWTRNIGTGRDDFGAGVSLQSDDTILFTGRYRGTTDFNPGPAVKRLRGFGVADAFVTAFDPDGILA